MDLVKHLFNNQINFIVFFTKHNIFTFNKKTHFLLKKCYKNTVKIKTAYWYYTKIQRFYIYSHFSLPL